MGSGLQRGEDGLADIFSKAEVVALGLVVLSLVDVVHDLGVVPHVVLGDAGRELSDVHEDLGLLGKQVQVFLQVGALPKHEGRLTQDAARGHDGAEEAPEGERLDVGDQRLCIGDDDFCVGRTGEHLVQIVAMNDSRHEASKGRYGIFHAHCEGGGGQKAGEQQFEGTHILYLLLIYYYKRAP